MKLFISEGPKSSKPEVQMLAEPPENRTFKDKETQTQEEPVESVNLDEKLLHSVAKKLGNKWQQLGRELGIKQVDLNIIKSDFPNDTAEQSFQMLYKWFQCCDPANRTLKTLTEALTEIECFDALERLSLDTN
ncbi:receptor-interacting serine/threonine-protein kinase 1 [Octopus sinensis]|uniref:Receptor-interacting serine/threonine-protein kinase 1 n=1 Tax=Octopus sinensis TaxID=2607531 RepID=A0A6P7TPT6_9MOLL|nr:receptor-interacting serine/threonine-protein kinase 1 [Octopus sinensis]